MNYFSNKNNNITVMNIIIFFVIIYFLSFIDFKENMNIIICIIITGIFIYYYVQNKDNIYKGNEIKPSKIIDKKYLYLNDFHELYDLVNSIKYMKKYCRRTYDISLKHLDNFLYYNEILKRKPFAPQQVFDLLKTEKKNCLNSFSAIIFSLPVSLNLNNKKTTNSLENFLFELETILLNIVTSNGKIINSEWKKDIKNDNCNMYKGPVSTSEPEPAPPNLDSNIFL